MAKTFYEAQAAASPAKFSTRAYNRCKICGRPHAYLRKYGVCRICFRVSWLTRARSPASRRLPGKPLIASV